MSKLPSTRERLHQVLQALGASAKKSLGQNFLVSDIVISKIITQVQNQKPQAVFEIGPGAGALTDYLIQICEEKKATFQVIELDRAFADYWRQRGLQVFEEDALQFDWSKAVQTPRTILVSNLPYQISSSLVIELSVQDIAFDFMTLMFQKEVAQRIRAQARSADYGLLSVIAQNFWTIQLVSEAGPKDFDPPPRVAVS